MSDADLYISNGDCYYGEGQISDPHFIPCGNSAISGTQSCCYQGDFCLSTNVCYDNDTAVTYITGCTDATFSSSNCPHKPGYPDQQWVALARCEGDDSDLFSGCDHHKDEIQIKHEDCTCDAASALISNPASGQPTLNQIGLLPTTPGGTISFNPTALPTATAASASKSGLSTSAKVGIGAGVGVGIPVIIVAIFLLWFIRRKKSKQQGGLQSEVPPQGPQQETDGPLVPMQHSPPPVYKSDFQNTQPGWLGYKPELHGESTDRSELPSDTQGINKQNMNSIQNTPLENYPPSELAIEHTGSSLYGASSVSFISPQSTGNTDKPQSGGGGHMRTGSNMDSISEYHIDK